MALRSVRDLKYLTLCVVGAQLFSTCSKRQYLAVIVSPEGRIVGTGYNGSPPGMGHCNDGHCPRMQAGSAPGSSYDNCIAVHAEQNAIMWSDVNARQRGTLYVNGPPCMTCARLIAGSGVNRLVYIPDDSYTGWPEVEAFLRKKGLDIGTISKIACVDRLDSITI